MAREAAVLSFMQQRSSRVVQRGWRKFARGKRTTAELAQGFVATGVLFPVSPTTFLPQL